MVADLQDRLDRDVPVVWDQINDRHETGLRSLQAFDPACSHHLVVQDDAVVCRDLVAGVEESLGHVPDGAPMALYVGRVKPFRRHIEQTTERAGDSASWLVMPGIYWGVGIVVPTVDLPELCAWYQTDGERIENYDRRVSTWFQTQGRECFYTWPSLVDHRDDNSLVPGHGAGRRAHRFIGSERSALDVDWSGSVVRVENAAAMDRARERRVRQAAGR